MCQVTEGHRPDGLILRPSNPILLLTAAVSLLSPAAEYGYILPSFIVLPISLHLMASSFTPNLPPPTMLPLSALFEESSYLDPLLGPHGSLFHPTHLYPWIWLLI